MSAWRRDEGSVMPFILGLISILAVFGTVVVDLSYVSIERARVNALADDVALVAATAIDVRTPAIISGTTRQRLALVSHQARSAATQELLNYPARDMVQRRLERFAVVDNAVQVRVSTRIRLPFTSLVKRAIGGDGSVVIRGSAAAATLSDPRR